MILRTTDEIFGALEKGDLSKDFATKVQEVLQALVDADGGNASVTLKLKFSSKGEMVTIKSKLDAVLPTQERRTSNFFVTSSGQLSLQHPNQIDIFAERRRDAADV